MKKIFEIVRSIAGAGAPAGSAASDQQQRQPLPEIVPGAAAGEAQPLKAGSAARATAPGAAHDQQQQAATAGQAASPAGHDQQFNCVIAGLVVFLRLTA